MSRRLLSEACSMMQLISRALLVPGTCLAGSKMLTGRAQVYQAVQRSCLADFWAHLRWVCSMLQLIPGALQVPGTCLVGLCMLTGRVQRHQAVQR